MKRLNVKRNNWRFYKTWNRIKEGRLIIKDQINLFAKVAYFNYTLCVTFLRQQWNETKLTMKKLKINHLNVLDKLKHV